MNRIIVRGLNADVAIQNAESAAVEASASAAVASAAAETAVDISNIAVPDDVVETLISGTGGAGPLTRAALSATIASEVPAAVPVATVTAQGKVELATSAETTTGTDTARAVTPAGVATVLTPIRDLSDSTLAASLATKFGTNVPNARGGIRNEIVGLTGGLLGTSGADVVGFQRNVSVGGNFAAMGGPSPGQVFGANNFSILDAVQGITSFYGSLSEVAITAPAGTTVTNVFGATSEASFFGAAAGATVTNIYSHRVMRPTRKSGAVAGIATNAYGLFIEGVSPTTLGSTTAFSLFVESGVSRFGGRVEAFGDITGYNGVLNLFASYTAAAGSVLRLDPNSGGLGSGGGALLDLSGSGAAFYIRDVSGAAATRFSLSRAGVMQVWDGSLKTVTFGANDSAGAGFKTMRVAN